MSGPAPRFAAVAVPLPIGHPLTYRVPPAFAPLARRGSRARVRVGKRRLVGTIVSLPEVAPAEVSLRDLDEIIDAVPVVPGELLDLARFVADYYLAPIGEVVRTMIPADLPPWGARRVWLTDAGAMARPRDADEVRVVEALRAAGRVSVAELQGMVGIDDLDGVLRRLRESGRVAVAESHGSGGRYVSAVELAAGPREELRERCGRSRKGRQVVDYLEALGRPATTTEVTSRVGCGDGVLRRLVSLGVLRRFTQVERLGLERHRFSAQAPGPPIELRADQSRAVTLLERALANRVWAPFLLHGVTGSGKTEVYLRAVEAALADGRSAIVLVPEIALIPALAATVRRRFGDAAALLHSGLGRAERLQEWERIRRGEAKVVLGPRSAVFAPVAELALIVVDEEQDASYKQDTAPRYHGRDLALVRARASDAVAVLVSATPSLESRHNVERDRMTSLRLTVRTGRGELPEGILVDLREEGAVRRPGEIHFSRRLVAELEATLGRGGQAILLRNRRGYAPILLCRACGEDLRCEACGLPRTLHKRDRRLLCHYCGSSRPVPERCPSCDRATLEAVGAGTERVEEELAELLPGVAVGVLDRDTVRREGGAAATLEGFARGTTRILVGTQMVSKGHHFPEVDLTAVLAADTYLGFPDFRAVERTYSLLTQLAGRAGRGERAGRIVIQTYHPDHYAIQAALAHDDDRFAAEEMRFRRVFHYPPFTRMIQLLLRDRNRARGEASMHRLAERIGQDAAADGIRLSGPAPAPLERLRGVWRFQLLARCAAGGRLRQRIRRIVEAEAAGLDLVVDVDPQQLM